MRKLWVKRAADRLGIVALVVPLAWFCARPAVGQVPAAGEQEQDTSPYVRGRGADWYVPELVDRDQATERFLLLLPEGPVVLEATITLNGKPYRHLCEGLIDDLLNRAQPTEAAEQPEDSVTATKAPAEGSPSALAAEGLPSALAAPARAKVAKFLAFNDGPVDRAEVRWLLSRFMPGPTLMTLHRRYSADRATTAPLLTLLDADGDDSLSPDEIAGAGARLASFDEDGDQVVTAGELASFKPVTNTDAPARRPSAWLIGPLGPATPWATVQATLQNRYGEAEPPAVAMFAHLPSLAESLDADADGSISAGELTRLASCPPQVQLQIRLGKTETPLAPVEVTALAPEWQHIGASTTGSPNTISLVIRPLALFVSAFTEAAQLPDNDVSPAALAARAEQLLRDNDADNNQYLDADEAAGDPELTRRFRQFDVDGNGMVFVEEIRRVLAIRPAPAAADYRISVGAVDLGQSLRKQVDPNADGRLTRQERNTLGRRLAALDLDGDGHLARSELARRVHIAFAVGPTVHEHLARPLPPASTDRPAASPSPAPAWFANMDRNRDGDVSADEFLGTPAHFKRFDLDGDGFLSAAEAVQADAAARPAAEE